ncbi:zinc finger protein 511 [Spea bombifrons]|uniref:zinc finger protein 511 n=1 Tax=Spea bombifrons TaxID=233779 RepID=UPI00234AE78B|nr:zinc finger protein 511 [Spea bombifrons]
MGRTDVTCSAPRSLVERKQAGRDESPTVDLMVSLEFFSALPGPFPVLNLAEVLVLPVDRKRDEADTFTARRVRFGREHEFFEDGDIHRHLYLQGVLTSIREVEEKPKVSEFRCQTPGCSQLFGTLESYERHYNALHRNVCSACKRSFPSARLLDIHILEWHDSLFQVMAEKTNMYQCLVEGCAEKFKTGNERRDHLIETHLYPPDFRFDRPKKGKSKPKQQKSRVQEPSMDPGLGEEPPEESMEIGPSVEGDGSSDKCKGAAAPSNHRAKHRVPRTICFGHGSVRGFRHARKNK